MNCIKCKRVIPDESLFCCYCGKKQTAEKKRRTKRANHDGGAWKRGSTYTAVWTAAKSELSEDGRIVQHRKTKGGFRTRKEAEDYAQAMRFQSKRPEEAPTLRYYWDTYSKNGLLKLSSSKISGYKKAWSRLEPLHDRSVDAIFVADMQKTIDDAVSTYWLAKDMRVLLSSLFKLAAGEGWVNKDLPELVTLPEMETKERVPFSEDEVAKLWTSYCDGNYDAGMALVMIYTGLMPGEITRLKPENIDFESGMISPSIGLKTKVRKKNGAVLNTESIAILKERCAEHLNKRGYLFYDHMRLFRKRYYAALETAGVRRLEPYSCRHTTATILTAKKNIPSVAVKRVMRWSTVKMYDVYAHPDEKDAKAAVEFIKPNVDNRVDNRSGLSGIEENR